MSRLSNALNMYMLLQSRRLVKVKDIAEILEVSPRMVKEYKKDLEKAGIYIGAKRGRHGGYYLENRVDLKGLGITKKELESLKMANEIIRSGNYLFSLDFEIFANKVLNLGKNIDYIDYFNKDTLKPLYMQKKEREFWKIISKGIISKRKINMRYRSLADNRDRENIQRIVHPYGTFNYDGAVYFFGYCELRKNIRYFKISRIQKLDILDDKFSINNTYDIKSILRTSFGIIDDEIFYLKLKISYPMSELVKEKQYSIEQKITELDKDTIIFEARLKGYPEVKSWVLSMGSKVEVLEPKRLKEDVIREVRKLRKVYE